MSRSTVKRSTPSVAPTRASTRFADLFSLLRQRGEKALGVYLTVGDPDVPATLRAADAAVRGGADFLELGAPFSDPSADGPVIQRAMERSLLKRTTLQQVVDVAAQLRAKHPLVPIVLFGYANPFFVAERAGWLRPALAKAGVDGVLMVDVPPEHDADFSALAEQVSLIRLLGPNATQARREAIAASASGFIYLVAIAGVTGASTQGALEPMAQNIKALRKLTPLPLCVGFGVRTKEDARRLAPLADGVIAGSVFVELLAHRDAANAVYEKVRELKAALVGPFN